MPSRLSSLLVRDGLVGVKRMEKAFQRQVIYGGSLDTIIASVHAGRQGHMPTWDERLTTAEMRTLALYVHDLRTQQP